MHVDAEEQRRGALSAEKNAETERLAEMATTKTFHGDEGIYLQCSPEQVWLQGATTEEFIVEITKSILKNLKPRRIDVWACVSLSKLACAFNIRSCQSPSFVHITQTKVGTRTLINTT
jgi:hypothetical protein